MWKHLLGGLYLVHLALLAVAAFGFFTFWARTRFWLPKYIHVLAGIAFLVMLGVLSMATADAPVNKWGLLSRVLFSLALPAIVYFVFVLYGGQRAAFDRSHEGQAPCPFCGHLVAAHPTGSTESQSIGRVIERQCPGCGQAINQ
jgi:hypothetical protein